MTVEGYEIVTYIHVVALDHGAEADPVAETVPCLIRINDIAFVVHLYIGRIVGIRRSFLLPGLVTLLLRCRLAFPYSAIAARVRPADYPGSWTLGSPTSGT
jgi:hypothetical protein